MKKHILLTIATAAIVFHSIAQKSKPVDNPSFPKDWIGNWKGALEQFKHNVQQSSKINMELNIQPSSDKVGEYTWNIVYGKPSKDNRSYMLRAVDSAKGHWMIDEMNGIMIDQYLIGNLFSGAFTVSNSTIVSKYKLENNILYVEFLTVSAEPVSTTGHGTEDSPYVKNHAIKGYQRAILTRK